MARESEAAEDGGQNAGKLQVEGSDASSDASAAGTMDADKDLLVGVAPPSSRVALSEQLIVSAALAYIDEFGLPGLSMRRLGSVLGVEAMSLYRYVAGREALLDAVTEAMTDLLDLDADVVEEPVDGWQDF